MRGPGDLRHDLERRRQERTEGVRITITGGRLPQRPLGSARWGSPRFPLVVLSDFKHVRVKRKQRPAKREAFWSFFQ